MDTPQNAVTTVFLHTSKIRDLPNYAKTFRMITEALVSDKAKLVIVMSDKEMDCGMNTKEKIFSVAEGLFKIYEEEN